MSAHNVFFDAELPDRERLDRLYKGDLFVYSPSRASSELCAHAREMIVAAFDGRDPLRAQYEMPVEEFVAIVAPLKTSFIHHPRSKALIAAILAEHACDPNQTYLDVPRLRIATHGGYLTSGVAYAHHPHRDTWYAAPMMQINWWLAIYDFSPESSMAFHPVHWEKGVVNGSSRFDYYDWNRNGRANAANQITSDTREQPKAEETVEVEPQIRIVPRAGAPILFSGAHLHSTVPNTSGLTRWSIDFRTVNVEDVRTGNGSPNVDSQPRGTSLRDFMRARDLERMPEEIALLHDGRTEIEGDLIFVPAMT